MKAMPVITPLFARLAQSVRPTPARVVALAGLALLGLLSHDASAQQTFNYVTGGQPQTYTVPAGAGGVTIVANGAGGGSGGNDELQGWGGTGGAGARATATYVVPAGTLLNIYVGQGGRAGNTSQGSFNRDSAPGAGGLSGGASGYAGGTGGMPGGSGYSGGGAGGGAASVVATAADIRLLVAGGGGGGQGGARGVRGGAGFSATVTGTYLTAAAGTAGASRANNEDGAGGGGGGGGCAGGAGGAILLDTSSGNGNNNPNNTVQATAGGSCANMSMLTDVVVTGGGGAGGATVTTGPTASGNSGGNGSITITPIYPTRLLSKSQPSPALAVNRESVYTLTVTAATTTPFFTATVTDRLPANLTYVSGVGTDWTCALAGTLVTCTYSSTLAATSSSIAITVKPTSTASVTNRASVGSVGNATPPTAANCTGNNTPAGCATPVTNIPTNAILNLVKSAPNPALQVFSNSAFTLTVTNTGTTASTTARVVDQLPANLTYVSGVGPGWTCSTAANAGGTLVTCNYSGSIAAGGGTAAVVITVTVTSGAPVTNYAAIDPSGGTTPPVPTTCTAANLPSAGCAAPVSTTAGRLVAGNVYSDANHNGSLDAGEAGIGGGSPLFVKLAPLSGGVCTGPATAAAAVSLSSGAYSLPSVAQGSYCLIVDGNNTLSDITPAYPAGWIATQNPTGLIPLVVGAAPPAPQNFGLYNGSKLSGNVFSDNGAGAGGANNGIKAGSEAGLASVTVNAMQGVAVVASASSGSDGSYLLWVPAAISGTVAITPALPSGYTATGGSAGTSGGSYTRPSISYTAAAGQSPTGVNFGMAPPNTLAPNGAQTAEPGTVVFYAHSYSAGTGGSVTFSLVQAATPTSPAWSQVLYQDSNCDATLGLSEPAVSAAITVTAGQTLCLIVKQFVPAGTSQGGQNSVTLSAAFSYANAPTLGVSTLTATDTTTVGQAGDLTLAKLVRNLSPVLVDGVPGPLGPFATSVNANPGNTLEYSLTATNTGAHALSTLFVSDTTTAFTTFVAAACPLPAELPTGITACVVTTQPAVGSQGALKWTFTGSLAPGALLKVTYQVKIDQ